jgi:cell division protein FtsI/penicillin-binding protein 2
VSNYTEEQTVEMVAAYVKTPTRETVEELAEKYEKSLKSIIGKLSREGVYQRQSYKTKTGETPVTKEELVSEIATGLEIDLEKLLGLEKAPKQTLKNILDALS